MNNTLQYTSSLKRDLPYIVIAESTLHSQTFLLLRCDLDIETDHIQESWYLWDKLKCLIY